MQRCLGNVPKELCAISKEHHVSKETQLPSLAQAQEAMWEHHCPWLFKGLALASSLAKMHPMSQPSSEIIDFTGFLLSLCSCDLKGKCGISILSCAFPEHFAKWSLFCSSLYAVERISLKLGFIEIVVKWCMVNWYCPMRKGEIEKKEGDRGATNVQKGRNSVYLWGARNKIILFSLPKILREPNPYSEGVERWIS